MTKPKGAETAGTCPDCGQPVYHRAGFPGEFDHACLKVERQAIFNSLYAAKGAERPAPAPDARAIVKHIADAALELAFVRHDLTSDELLEGDKREDFIEDIKRDTFNCLTGDDSGCLDPEELDETNCELLWLDAQLRRRIAPEGSNALIAEAREKHDALLDRITELEQKLESCEREKTELARWKMQHLDAHHLIVVREREIRRLKQERDTLKAGIEAFMDELWNDFDGKPMDIQEQWIETCSSANAPAIREALKLVGKERGDAHLS